MIRKIIIMESQAGCLGEFLVESQESKSISAAKRLVMQRLGYNEQQADEFVRIKLRNDIPALSEPKPSKFILGVARMFCDGELTNSRVINDLNKTLELVASETHINDYDRNLSGLSAKQLIDRFAKVMNDNFEAEKGEVEKMVFDTPSNYEIVRIDSFKDAAQYGSYTSWCVTHNKRMFDNYTCNGINQFYFCLKPNFENVKRIKGENYPSDEYGLSMIAVSVNDKGGLHTCTCRWNHGDNNDGACNDKFIKNMKGLAQFFGFNPFEVFKPNGKWEELLNNAMQRIANGEQPKDVFDWCVDFSEGFARVKLGVKWNYIDTNGNILSKQWFDSCGNFNYGFGAILLNNKWNYIDKDGNILSEQWFDDCLYFYGGFGRVELNGKWNYIDKNGDILSKQWFDSCGYFEEGFATVKLGGKWNYINKSSNILSDKWFDDCTDFHEGLGIVGLDGKYNFINVSGSLLSDQWFDDCTDFHEGLIRVKSNKKWNYLDKNGNILSEEWFDWCGDFIKGFSSVLLNGKYYNIDKNGNLTLAESRNHKKILMSEEQLMKLNESQESKSISAAKRLVMQRLGYNEKEADEFVRVKLRNDLHTLREPNGAKFILGAARMFCDGELRTANDIGNLDKTLELVASDAHINEYDRNLNGLSAQDLIQRFAKVMSDNFETEKGEVERMEFTTPSDYEIVRIDSFEDATRYGNYTSWCVTHDERMFDSYTNDGINQFYFCLKPNFKSIKRIKGDTYPSDEYGLSMIAVSVNDRGMLNTCTCRWNHGDNNDGACNDKFVKNMKGLAQLIGVNPFEVFKPNGKWQELLNNALQRLANGERPQDVFDWCSSSFDEGLAKVKLNNKYNFIDKNGNLLCDQWFDYCLHFYRGFGIVTLNNKYNYIDKNGNILSKQWFDSCDDFLEGFGVVMLNGKSNHIDKNGNYLNKQWFDYCGNFSEGFAAVELNNKRNFIDKNGNYLSNQWFDGCSYFLEGFALVLLNDKYNYIDKNGNILSEEWFDGCGKFRDGFAKVELDGKYNFINVSGKLLSDQWFDSCTNEFSYGFVRAKINGRVYEVDKDGNLSQLQFKV